jgi:ketosteroid isomerase-like protein
MSDRTDIERQRTTFVEAFNREDLDRLATLLTDDHVGMPPNRPQLKGRDASRRFWTEGISVGASRFAVRPDELAIIGDLAIDQFHWSVDSTPRAGGTPVHDEGKCVWIWQRQRDGEWRILRAIWNSDLATAGLWSGAGVRA